MTDIKQTNWSIHPRGFYVEDGIDVEYQSRAAAPEAAVPEREQVRRASNRGVELDLKEIK